MWRYIDPDGNTQGPFPAQNMIEWHTAGYLHDMSLPVCGTVGGWAGGCGWAGAERQGGAS